MSYEKSLVDYLAEKSISLSQRLPEIEKHAKEILQYAQGKFPYYTPHGFMHSENVLENLNWLIQEEVKAQLNAQELFFLITSAWLHDWGMIGEAHEDSDEIRNTHNIRTEEKLEKHHNLIGLSLNEARIIGLICRGHRKEDLFDEKYDDTPFETGIMIHLRFLTAILRIADEVDVTYSRVPEIIFYELNPTDKAEEEFKKQMDIRGISYPSDKEKHKLTLSGIAYDPIAVTALNKLRDKIQTELNDVKTVLATGLNGKSMSLDYIDLKLITRGFRKESIEFEVDKQKVLDLLIGRSLYKRKDVAIRELIQNSIDACKLRTVEEGYFNGEITVTINEDTLSVEDNGIGMDFTTAKNYLSLVGSSFYTSESFKKIKESSKSFDPISRWGLGVLSCFLISSKVIIETKKVDNPQACRFIISSVDKGWRYENSSRQQPGTKITLCLNDYGQKIDFTKAINYYIKSSEIPIFISINGTAKKFEPNFKIQNEIEENSRSLVIQRQIKQYGKTKFTPLFKFETDEFGVELFQASRHIYNYKLFEDNYFVCLQGIKTNLPKTIDRIDELIIFLSIKKNIVDIDVSRDFLIDNERLRELLTKIFSHYIKFHSDYFEKTNRKTGFERQYEKYGYLDTSVLTQILYKYLDHKKFFEENILESIQPVLNNEGLSFQKFESLLRLKPKKVIIFNMVHYASAFPGVSDYIERMKTLVQSTLLTKEIALVYFGPFSYTGKEILIDLLKKNKINVREATLNEYAAKYSQILKTSIDCLLPKYCNFSIGLAYFSKHYFMYFFINLKFIGANPVE